MYTKTTILQTARNHLISAFQLCQEFGPFGLGPSSSHNLAPVDCLTLALGWACGPVRQQISDAKRLGVGEVGVQRMHQRRSLLDDPHPRVAVAVDPTLMPLREPEPPLQVIGIYTARTALLATTWDRSAVSAFGRHQGVSYPQALGNKGLGTGTASDQQVRPTPMQVGTTAARPVPPRSCGENRCVDTDGSLGCYPSAHLALNI